MLKPFIPSAIWNVIGKLRRRWNARDDHLKTPREVFSRIYLKKEWNHTIEDDEPFFSGKGSISAQITEPYVEGIRRWANTQRSKELTVIDLGCGDFRVGRRISDIFKKYIACDIVPELISYHQGRKYPGEVSFLNLDAITDNLPQGDVCFVRQVFQHLSNEQISKILPKLIQYRFVIITEHLPHPNFLKEKNLDKCQGGNVRADFGSGVYLSDPPFSWHVKETKVLIEVPYPDPKDGVVQTVLYTL